MEISELNGVIYFQEKALSYWLNLIALAILLLILPIVVFYWKNRIAFKQQALIFAFFNLGLILFVLLGASLVYPISQYQNLYEVHLDTKNSLVRIVSGEEKKVYQDSLQQYSSFYKEDKTKINAEGKVSGTINAYLMRKDGLMVFLGAFNKNDYVRVKTILENNRMSEIANVLEWYRAVERGLPEIRKQAPLVSSIKGNSVNLNSDANRLKWTLHVSSLVIKIAFGLLTISWLFFILKLAAGSLLIQEKLFSFLVLGILTFGFGFYFINTQNAHYTVITNKDNYETKTETMFLNLSKDYSGKFSEVKYISTTTRPGDYLGVMISEQSTNSNNGYSQFMEIASGAFDGKFKYIRTEELSIHDRILLHDFFYQEIKKHQGDY